MRTLKIFSFALALVASSAWSQDFIPNASQVPYAGPMGPGSAGDQFMGTGYAGGYAQAGVMAGTGQVPGYMQVPGGGNVGCGVDRYGNTRLVNQGGLAIPAPGPGGYHR